MQIKIIRATKIRKTIKTRQYKPLHYFKMHPTYNAAIKLHQTSVTANNNLYSHYFTVVKVSQPFSRACQIWSIRNTTIVI